MVQRYPRTEYAADARLKIDMVNDQLAGKEMTIGRWYLRQGDTLENRFLQAAGADAAVAPSLAWLEAAGR